MPFAELSLELQGLDAGLAEALFAQCGALSITLSDARDDAVLEPAPGEVRLWPATRLAALYPEPASALAARLIAAARLGIAPERIELTTLADRIWEREWLRDFHPMRFGRRLWVCPRHARIEDPSAAVVRLDPGLAFGTGTHPTTAQCLAFLDEALASGAHVIDYGCGSGILALAAARLGARRVQCFDIDPQALLAARENAHENQLPLEVCAEDARLTPGADLLIANILAGPLCELAPRFAQLARAGGTVALAGLLAAQAAEVTRAYAPWFDMRCHGVRDEWALLVGSRRAFEAHA